MKYEDINLKGRMTIADPTNTRPSKIKGVVVLFAFLIIVGGLIYTFRDVVIKAFDPISVVASVSGAKLKETDGRTNILLLGSDRRDGNSVIKSVLTDTILVASIGKVDNDVVLISVPRDLWVQSPSGRRSKINEVYINEGIEALKKTLENVLGIPIHYYALVTFDMFEQTIDILGGVNINVDAAFTDYEYPVENKETDMCGRSREDADKLIKEGMSLVYIFPCRYETVSFTAGPQTMNGKTALKFVRSRHGDNDFARAKRQQKLIAAIKEKGLSMQTLLDFNKIKSLYDSYVSNVDTNIDLGTVQSFYLLSKQIDFAKVVSIVLDDRSGANEGGLLYAPQDTTLYNNAYVLIPQTGDYSQIHAFVQKYLFGNK
jgi:LCP family protein required for cell wall assembly